ncbi:transcription factor IIA, alpha/beta subunit [Lipomyces oligophaga]|uniref:transcription factor IIA, alpha/beta subunit n=1 Tax=Lipomyces oligophaga TaxID=45792 RepID=UPI0034CEA314
MSNSIVGDVYRDIIEDVINASRLDFEDAGIDESVLRDLQALWQERLSMTRVAQFPWDPEPVDPDPSEGGIPGAVPSGLMGGEVKYEMQSPLYSTPTIPPPVPTQAFSNPTMAAMRAAQHIQEFAREEKVPADVADESIKGVMKRAGLDEKQRVGQQYSDQNGLLQNNGRISQVDGANDEEDSNDTGRLSQKGIDKLIEHRILVRKDQQEIDNARPSPSSITIRRSRKTNKLIFTLSQTDGPLDSDSDDDDDGDLGLGGGSHGRMKDEDPDAINSELDDSEGDENSQDDSDAEESTMLMLCLYDTVTRTKNKWKCKLKDGLVNVNGRDYLFGKGSGEYEW